MTGRAVAWPAALLLGVAVLATSDALVRAQEPPRPVSARSGLSEERPANLVVWNRTLAVLRTSFEGSTPQQRAEAAAARIEVALDRLSPDQVRSAVVRIGADRGVMILGGAETLFGIHERDLPQETATSLEAAGALAVGRLQTIVRERTEQRRWPVLLRSIALSVLATLIFGAAWLFVARLRHRVARRVTALADRRLAHGPVADLDTRPLVFPALIWLTRVATFAVVAAAAYMWLTFVLNHFAYSRPWGARLGGLLIDTVTRLAAGIVNEIPSLITLGVVLLVTRGVASAVRAWFHAVEREDLSVAWLDPLAARAGRKLVVLGIWLFAITMAYPYIPGAETDAFKGVSVLIGLMISLGSAGVIGQVMSGFFVIFNRALRPGEFVQVGDVQGVVRDLGLMSIRIVARGQREVSIPNAVVIGTTITNLSRAYPASVVLTTSATIGYDAPWRQVRALLLLAAARTQGVLQVPKPDVLETTLSDFYVEYELVAHGTTAVPRPVLMSRLHEQILDVFNEHGVQIMSPHFEGQPDKAVVVPRSRWFAQPAAAPTGAEEVADSEPANRP